MLQSGGSKETNLWKFHFRAVNYSVAGYVMLLRWYPEIILLARERGDGY